MNNLIIFSYNYKTGFGGMESHFLNMIEYFKYDNEWTCKFIVYKDNNKIILQSLIDNTIIFFKSDKLLSLYLYNKFKNTNYCLFFNDGRWIESLHIFREYNKRAILCQRSGGNEFMKAPLFNCNMSLEYRQKKWAEIINKNLDFIISNSDFTTDRLKSIGVLSERIIKIRGGVDKENSINNILSKNNLRETFNSQYNISNKKYIIISAARFTEFKGIDNLINAIGLSKYKKDILLVLVGDGDLKESLVKSCKSNLDEKSFIFLGATSYIETMKYIAAADLYCSTSISFMKASGQQKYIHTETMGRSILEAICQRTCIIATDVGGVSEWFRGDYNIGRLISYTDISTITKAIDDVISSNFYIDDVSGYFLQQYSWKVVFNKYKVLWREYFE